MFTISFIMKKNFTKQKESNLELQKCFRQIYLWNSVSEENSAEYKQIFELSPLVVIS